MKATEAAATPARREQSGNAVACDGNKMAVRVQWAGSCGQDNEAGRNQ